MQGAQSTKDSRPGVGALGASPPPTHPAPSGRSEALDTPRFSVKATGSARGGGLRVPSGGL